MRVSTAVAPAANGEDQAALWGRWLLVLARAWVLVRAVGLLTNVLSLCKAAARCAAAGVNP